MIQETITYRCHRCGSTNIVRNGTNKCGNPQYHCKVWAGPGPAHTPEAQAQVYGREEGNDPAGLYGTS